MQELVNKGVSVFCASGIPIRDEYHRANRNPAYGRGIHHLKLYVRGDWVICGSTNWTLSSRCNTEMSFLLKLSYAGKQELMRRLALVYQDSITFADACTRFEADERKHSSARANSVVTGSSAPSSSAGPHFSGNDQRRVPSSPPQVIPSIAPSLRTLGTEMRNIFEDH